MGVVKLKRALAIGNGDASAFEIHCRSNEAPNCTMSSAANNNSKQARVRNGNSDPRLKKSSAKGKGPTQERPNTRNAKPKQEKDFSDEELPKLAKSGINKLDSNQKPPKAGSGGSILAKALESVGRPRLPKSKAGRNESGRPKENAATNAPNLMTF